MKLNENICNYIPSSKEYDYIKTFHYVYETSDLLVDQFKSPPFNKMYYVTSGNGELHLTNKIVNVTKGDIFFTFTADNYFIRRNDGLSYIYVSYLGKRANMIHHKLGIGDNNRVFNSCEELEDIWTKGIHYPTELSDITSEGVLFATFAYLGNRLVIDSENKESDTLAFFIKKYIDDNISSQNLSLETIGAALRYNPKYISRVFKSIIGIGFSKYVNAVRIQHACTMISQGFRSISDISFKCGFSDSQYFSKIFKQVVGSTPSEYIRNFSAK